MSSELKSTKGCGRCCAEMGRPPFLLAEAFRDPSRQPDRAVTTDDFDDFQTGMPRHLQEEMAAYIQGVRRGEDVDRQTYFLPCFWLDLETGLCKHYAWRPQKCRDHDCTRDANCLITLRGLLE